MVRSPFACSATIVRIIRKALPPLVAVPFLHTVEPCPNSVNRMLRIRTKMSKFPGEHGSTPCGIDEPTSVNDALHCVCRGEFLRVRSCRGRRASPSVDANHCDRLPGRTVQFAICYLRGAPEVTACTHGEVQHV